MSSTSVGTGGPLEVLLVGTDDSDLKSLQEMLTSEGIKVHVSKSGAEAMAFLESHNVDVVISDLALKEMSGACLTSMIKAESCDIYVILVTQLSGYQLIAEAIAAGADKFLARPIKRGQLITLLQNVRTSKV